LTIKQQESSVGIGSKKATTDSLAFSLGSSQYSK